MRVPAWRCLGLVTQVLAGAAVLGTWSSASAQTGKGYAASAKLSPELQQARAGLEKYQDPIVAIHDGYFSTLACVEYKQGTEGHMHYTPGGMGVHFLNLQTIGPKLDPAKPQVLIYEPHGDRLQLAAAEWFVPTEVAAGTRPSIFGQELQGPMEGHEPLQPKGLHHYDLHVWLWKENPAGVFSPTNPAVKCPKGSYSFTEQAPKIVEASAK
ncbi:MAG TPA: hypothetical protein VJQ46_12180 [Gemmatimonadales bacterium]|nr:hypothetical protein [Gemmatimonadales bacterium]